MSCVILFGAVPAIAQTDAEQGTLKKRQEQLQRQEQDKRRVEELERKRLELKPPASHQDPRSPSMPDQGKCVDVIDISLEGTSVLSGRTIENATAPYRGRCLSISDVQELLDAIKLVYHNHGYVTSRAFLPEQDLRDGVLILTVLEGTLESMTLDDDGREGAELFFAFPVASGDLLNMRDIEQGLDQMNRLLSNNTSMEIVPGDGPGSSRINVSNQVGERFRFQLGRDNSGSPSTGLQQNLISFDADNFFGINDTWQLSYNRTALNYSDKRRSQSLSVSASAPFGYWTFHYAGNYYDYSSFVIGEIEDFYIRGLSRSNAFKLSNVLHRDQTSKTRMDGELTVKEGLNFIEDAMIEASSRRLSVGSLELSHSRRQWGGVLLLTVGHERGLVWFDALKDAPDHASDAPQAQFRKWTLDGSYYGSFAIADEAFSWKHEAAAQFSPDPLYGTERFGLGGVSSVRGFRDETLSADNGFYLRNEINWTMIDKGFWGTPEVEAAIGKVVPYVAYDWGMVSGGAKASLERGALSGITLGVRNEAENLTMEAAYSRVLSSSTALEEKGHDFNFKVALKF